jgi:hypothetical protein
MTKLLLAHVAGGTARAILEIDLDDWSESIGEGGFGVAFVNRNDPGAILKCMDGVIASVDAQPTMLKLSRHAKVMTERLSQIISDTGTPGFARSACQTLLTTITTHVGYEPSQGRIYLYQRRAPGCSLASLLSRDPPDWRDRLRIAKNFSSVMVALRRCNVVHLDQRPVNVFVSSDSPAWQVTLIDLDGCGVLHDQRAGESLDEWQTPPATMGRAEDMAKPLWFPFDPTWQGPLSGNFKFAERWCVINEMWKILSWGMPALGWIEAEHDDLLDGAQRVQEMFKAGVNHLPADRHAEHLVTCQRAIARELSGVTQAATIHTRSLKWAEYNVGSGSPEDDTFFRNLGLATLWAFVNAKDKRLPEAIHPPHAREIPSAQWIQNALLHQYGP